MMTLRRIASELAIPNRCPGPPFTLRHHEPAVALHSGDWPNTVTKQTASGNAFAFFDCKVGRQRKVEESVKKREMLLFR